MRSAYLRTRVKESRVYEQELSINKSRYIEEPGYKTIICIGLRVIVRERVSQDLHILFHLNRTL